MTTAGIILAAGAGRRFGGAKQLALYEGELLVRRACRTAIVAGLSPVIVVLGAHADAVRAAVHDLSVIPLLNLIWANGMGTSLACAIRALDGAIDAGGDARASASVNAHAIADAAVMLADQPLVTSDHIRALVTARRNADVDVAVTDSGTAVGVPAVFSRTLFPALAALTGDRGARDIIATHPRRVTLAFAAAAFDIDVPAQIVIRDCHSRVDN